MSFGELARAALELGVIPAIAIFLIFGLFLQNRRLLADQRRLLEKFAEVVLRAQVLQGKDTAQMSLPDVRLEPPAPPALPPSRGGEATPRIPEPARLAPSANHGLKVVRQAYGSLETAGEGQPPAVLVLQPQGKITIGVGDVAVRGAVKEALEEGWRRVVLDLARVSTMDSSGIGELVAAYTTVANQSGSLALCRPPDKVRDVLTVTQLITVFDVYEDLEEAVTALRQK